MKKILTICLISLALLSLQAQINVNKSFVFGGVLRDYIIHLPTGYSSSTQYPVVFNLHGYTSNAAEEQLYTQMDVIADHDAEQFIVVYPNGIANYWNSFTAGGTDDVGFISTLIDSMNAQYSIDLDRVYSCGMSNGGFQSYRLACELNNRIAAIASVTGSMSDYVYTNCHPTHPVPVLEIHGTADATVPYTGLAGSQNTETVIQFWKNNNGCGTSDTTAAGNINTSDSSTVDKIKFNGCNNGTKVWFFKVWNGGHTWPDAAINLAGVNTNRDIHASQEIWDFFKQYRLSEVTSIHNIQSEISLHIFPNPVQGILHIQSSTPISEMKMIDMLGNTVLVWNLNKPLETDVDLSSLQNGLYTLQVLDASHNLTTKRVLVQH